MSPFPRKIGGGPWGEGPPRGTVRRKISSPTTVSPSAKTLEGSFAPRRTFPVSALRICTRDLPYWPQLSYRRSFPSPSRSKNSPWQ